MYVLYISEYNRVFHVDSGNRPLLMAREPAITDQTVTIGAGSLQSNAFNANTNFVRIEADAVCSILFGSNPTAAATNKRISAGVPEYFGVIPGQKVAVITNS